MEPKTGRSASGDDDRHPSVVIEGSGAKVSCELPIGGADGWYVSAVFLEEDGQLVMAELKVFPGPGTKGDGRRSARRKPGDWSGQQDALQEVPDGGVSARLLRCIRLTDLQQLVMSELPPTSTAVGQRTGGARVGRPGSAGRPDRQYAEWAFRYAKKLAEGSRSPIKDLAAEHGRSPGQVRDLIHDARVRGLLSKERQGRAAGSLTPKAIQLLRGDE
ncbi:MAG TPA: hypothetical protein VK988_08500 [Acidimicrobiales bacterium]|nr:hypothetical protein [Acidimicrobiales bacterium]